MGPIGPREGFQKSPKPLIFEAVFLVAKSALPGFNMPDKKVTFCRLSGGARGAKTFFEQKKSVKPSLNYPKTIQEHIVIGFVAPQKNRHWLQNRLTRQNML